MKKYLITIMTLTVIAAWVCPVIAYEFEGVDIHGFISQGYLKSSDYNYIANDSKEGSFSYNEMGINFSKGLSDKLHVGIQLFARDLGDVANNELTVDWAYADYRWRDWLGLRIGKIKLPYGLHNETRDMDMLRTCIILPQGIYNDLLRDTLVAAKGGGVYGNISLGDAGSIDYQGIIGNIEANLGSGVGKYAGDELRETLTLDGIELKTAYAGSLKWNTFFEGLAFNFSILKVDPEISVTYESFLPVIGGMTDSWNVKDTDLIFSLEYTWNNLYFASEYYSLKRKTLPNIVTSGSDEEIESYYFMASYRLADNLEIGAYYSAFYPNKDNKSDFTRWQKDTAVSIRYEFNDNWLVKVEGHFIDGVADVVLVDNPTMEEKEWNMFAVKMTYNF